jgi:hypothetical protein
MNDECTCQLDAVIDLNHGNSCVLEKNIAIYLL